MDPLQYNPPNQNQDPDQHSPDQHDAHQYPNAHQPLRPLEFHPHHHPHPNAHQPLHPQLSLTPYHQFQQNQWNQPSQQHFVAAPSPTPLRLFPIQRPIFEEGYLEDRRTLVEHEKDLTFLKMKLEAVAQEKDALLARNNRLEEQVGALVLQVRKLRGQIRNGEITAMMSGSYRSLSTNGQLDRLPTYRKRLRQQCSKMAVIGRDATPQSRQKAPSTKERVVRTVSNRGRVRLQSLMDSSADEEFSPQSRHKARSTRKPLPSRRKRSKLASPRESSESYDSMEPSEWSDQSQLSESNELTVLDELA